MFILNPKRPDNRDAYKAYATADTIAKFLIKAEATGNMDAALDYFIQKINKYDSDCLPEANDLCDAIRDYYLQVDVHKPEDLDFVCRGLWDALIAPTSIGVVYLIPRYFLGFGSTPTGVEVENYDKYIKVAEALSNFLCALWED